MKPTAEILALIDGPRPYVLTCRDDEGRCIRATFRTAHEAADAKALAKKQGATSARVRSTA